MKDRESPESPFHSAADAEPDVDTAFAELIQAAKADQPDAKLAERVRAGLAYRRALMQGPTGSRSRASRLVAVGAAFATAAVVLVFVYRFNARAHVRISPETSVPAGSPSNQVTAKEMLPAPDPCLGRHAAEGKHPLIDDFEDGDDEVARFEGRSGLWRWVRDTDAKGTAPALLPIPRGNSKPDNRLALHVKGGQLLDWGAVIEFNFVPGCYDASRYKGLSFQAKGPGRVFVAPREVSVIPIANGGTCREDCHNPHVKKIELDAQWRTYEVQWGELAQRGYNKPALDPSRLNSVAFLVHPEDTPYDVWVDEVKFLQR